MTEVAMGLGNTMLPSIVDDKLLAEVVRRLLAVGSPEKVILFGSRARGDERPDSDLDVLIIEQSGEPRYRRASRYLRALTGIFPEKDVVVWTSDEVREWEQVPNAFITTAIREGRVLYERQARPLPRLAS